MNQTADQGNTVMLALTALVLGAAAILGALVVLDVDNWRNFLGYFVLIPMGNICLGIAIWLGINELRGHR